MNSADGQNKSWLTGARARALIYFLAIFMFFAGLGSFPFIDRDEGEYATVAMEMIERNDYVIPHVNGRAYYEKPALFFWLTALSFKVFGYNETAGRLPSALAALALVFLMDWFGRRRGSERFGLLTSFFMVASLLTALLARVAILDTLLALWTTATLVFFYEGYAGPAEEERKWFLLSWASMGLAFLTKGPVGAAVPLGAVFFLTLFNRDMYRSIVRARVISGLLVFLIISGPWYVLAFLREGRNFWEGFFISQNVTRFTEVLLGHGAPIWFYLPVLAVLVWPWSFFAAPVIWRSIKTKRTVRLQSWASSFDFFATIWFLSSLLIFTSSATKQPNYIFPAVPPLVFLAARWWDEWLAGDIKKTGEKWGLFSSTAFIGLVLAVFLMVVPFIIPMAMKQARADVRPDSFEYAFQEKDPDLGYETAVTGLAVGGASIAALFLLKAGRRRRALAAWSVGSIVLITGLFHWTAPAALDYLQTPGKELTIRMSGAMNPGDRLAAFGLYKPTLWYYSGRHIDRIRATETDKLQEYLKNERRTVILSRLSLLPVLKLYPEFRLIEKNGGYIAGDNGGGRTE